MDNILVERREEKRREEKRREECFYQPYSNGGDVFYYYLPHIPNIR